MFVFANGFVILENGREIHSIAVNYYFTAPSADSAKPTSATKLVSGVDTSPVGYSEFMTESSLHSAERAKSGPKRSRIRLYILLCIGGLLVGGALWYIIFHVRRPVGEGPAGPDVPTESFQQPWSTQDVLLFGLGDSVTAGLGAKSADHSYFNRLIQNPPDEFPSMEGLCLQSVLPNLRTQNVAISGSTSLQHIEV